jgi:hypothetical protein
MSHFLPKLKVDGARNTVAEVSVTIDDKEGFEPRMLLDITKAYRDPRTPASSYCIEWVEFHFPKDLEGDLWWETLSGPRHLCHLEGKGKVELESRGGAQNSIDDATGCVLFSASGWAGKPIYGSFTIHATKH